MLVGFVSTILLPTGAFFGDWKDMLQTLKALMRDETGVTALKYGHIAALIAVVIIGAVSSLGSNLSTTGHSTDPE